MPTIRRAESEDLAACLAVRRRVFIEEQAVPESLEVDGLDPGAVHFVAESDGQVVGTARMRVFPEKGWAKAERVAVLSSHRGRGLGAELMEALEAEARRRGLASVMLHAQITVFEFYLGRGYIAHGERFEEAGIVHQEMRLSLDTPDV